MNRKSIPLLLLVIISLSGCFYVAGDPAVTPILKTDLPNPQLFEQDDCLAGCWRGQRPGITTKDDFEKFFMTLTFPNIYISNSDGYSVYTRGSSKRNDEYYIEANVKAGLLKTIWLEGPFNLTLQKVVEKIGFPEQITVWTIQAGGDANISTVYTYLLYSNHGYVIGTMPSTKKSESCITQDDMINSVVILEAGTIENLVSDWNISQNGSVIHNIESGGGLKPWTGFGCISVK